MAIISPSSKQTWAFLFIHEQKHVILLGTVTSVFSKAFWLSLIKLLDVKLQSSLLDKVVWDSLAFSLLLL